MVWLIENRLRSKSETTAIIVVDWDWSAFSMACLHR
jgi:hypothetical protein